MNKFEVWSSNSICLLKHTYNGRQFQIALQPLKNWLFIVRNFIVSKMLRTSNLLWELQAIKTNPETLPFIHHVEDHLTGHVLIQVLNSSCDFSIASRDHLFWVVVSLQNGGLFSSGFLGKSHWVGKWRIKPRYQCKYILEIITYFFNIEANMLENDLPIYRQYKFCDLNDLL